MPNVPMDMGLNLLGMLDAGDGEYSNTRTDCWRQMSLTNAVITEGTHVLFLIYYLYIN